MGELMREREGRRTSGLLVQLLRFGVVGGIGWIVDVGAFNLLRAAAPYSWWPLAAKACSTLMAILVNWVGNRLWTFRDHRREDTAREAAEFLIASLIGGGVSLLCLAISRGVLGLETALDDNLSANVIGLLLGSAVRFCAYRWWVFGDRPATSPGVRGRRMPTSAPSRSERSDVEPPPRSAIRETMARPSPPPA